MTRQLAATSTTRLMEIRRLGNSGREELRHPRRRGRRAGELRDTQRLEDQAQRALVLVERRRRVARLSPRADDDPGDPAPSVGIVASRLVEQDDEQAVPLERRACE